jgi:hypothetical protein
LKMEVNIEDVVSTVRTVDGDSLLTPNTLRRIVNVVLQAVDEREAHARRVRAEQRISGGVREELEEER